MQHEARHRDHADIPERTTLEIALAQPSGDAAHLLMLLRERLERMELPAPVLELRLHCSELVHDAPPNSDLFPTPAGEREGLLRLVERLQARLGPAGVQCLVPTEDPRPERSTAMQTFGVARSMAHGVAPALTGSSGAAVLRQPVWLLPALEPLAERRSLPLLQGETLRLLAGPERIEAGWWDGALLARDYFVAQARDGSLVWVFRQRLPALDSVHGWFLHGRFG